MSLKKRASLSFYTIHYIKVYSILALIIALIVLAFGFIYYSLRVAGLYEKSHARQVVSALVKNNADLSTVEHFMGTKNEFNFKYLFRAEHDFYPADTKAATVLNDVKLMYIVSGITGPELANVNSLLEESRRLSPFMILPDTEKKLFEEIQLTLGDNYHLVENDISTISKTMAEKNGLVNEYLSDSKLSFWISVLGLAISLISSPLILIFSKKNKINQSSESEINSP